MSNTLVQQALSKTGYNSRYQKMLLIFFAIAWFEIAYLLLGCSFVFMNPNFRCTFSSKLVTQDVACPRIDECVVDNDFTITAYAGLYCENQGSRDMIQSFLYMGSIIGLFGMNVVSDTKGRKFGFLVAMSTATVGIALNVIGAYWKTVWVMAIAQMMCGFGGYSCMIIGYIIISDLCQGDLKGYGIIAMNGFWGIAEMSYVLFYFYMPEWYNYLILIQLIPNIGILFIFAFFVPETPSFYVCKLKDEEKCMQSLAHIALFNGKGTQELDQARVLIKQAIKNIEEEEKQNKQESQSPIMYLLKHPVYRRTIIMVAIIEISTNMYYYCVQFSLNDLGYNYGVDILLAGTAETLSYFSINLFINKVRRRQGLLLVNTASFIFGALYAFDFISENLVIASIFICLCRWFNTYSQGFIPLLQTESFPEKVQSSGAGMIEGTSQLGSFITPYVMALFLNSGKKPIIYFAIIVLVVGIIPLKWVKETLVKKSDNPLDDSLLNDSSEGDLSREQINS